MARWANVRLDTCICMCVLKIYTFLVMYFLLVMSLGLEFCLPVQCGCDLLLKAL